MPSHPQSPEPAETASNALSRRGRSKTRGEGSVTRTLDRGLALLESLADRPEMSLSDLARSVRVTPTTASRLLDTLKLRGFVMQTDSGLYRIGVKALIVGSAVLRANRLDQVAVTPMLRLSSEVGETVSLGIRDGNSLIYVEQVEGPNAIRVTTPIGKRIPIHATAGGKVLLCSIWEKAFDTIIGPGPYQRLTANTITDRNHLTEAIEQVRVKGWAIDNEESEINLCCLAAPIRDRRGEVVAALSVSMFIGKASHRNIEAMAGQVMMTAKDISLKLGWQDMFEAARSKKASIFSD